MRASGSAATLTLTGPTHGGGSGGVSVSESAAGNTLAVPTRTVGAWAASDSASSLTTTLTGPQATVAPGSVSVICSAPGVMATGCGGPPVVKFCATMVSELAVPLTHASVTLPPSWWV